LLPTDRHQFIEDSKLAEAVTVYAKAYLRAAQQVTALILPDVCGGACCNDSRVPFERTIGSDS
jgi:hypothetical protein